MEVFQAMGNYNFRPCIEIFNILIDGMCRVGEIGKAKLLFDRIFGIGLIPNVITYTILINSLCNEGLLEEANGLFLQMEGNDFLPNTCTFNAIICGFCRVNEMHKAIEFLHIMATRYISALSLLLLIFSQRTNNLNEI